LKGFLRIPNTKPYYCCRKLTLLMSKRMERVYFFSFFAFFLLDECSCCLFKIQECWKIVCKVLWDDIMNVVPCAVTLHFPLYSLVRTLITFSSRSTLIYLVYIHFCWARENNNHYFPIFRVKETLLNLSLSFLCQQ
jgi:hypothetical protein